MPLASIYLTSLVEWGKTQEGSESAWVRCYLSLKIEERTSTIHDYALLCVEQSYLICFSSLIFYIYYNIDF